MLNEKIFKAYDIRGLYPDEIDKGSVYAIARAYTRFMKLETGRDKLVFCLGRDARPSSDEFFEAFAKGVMEEGGKVVNIGLVTTPLFYFAVSNYGYDGGVNITASHNPNPYNGLKLVKAKAVPLMGGGELLEIKKMAQSLPSEELLFEDKLLSRPTHPLSLNDSSSLGSIIEEKDVLDEYINQNLRLAGVEADSFSGMRIAVDAGNGTGGIVAEKFFKKFNGLSIEKLYFEPDGRFPNHIPDPLIEKNVTDLKNKLSEGGFDLGIAFDGDADRVMFFDERGDRVRSDLVTAIMARVILRDNPKALIGYDLRSSGAVERIISESGGRGEATRVGHTLIKSAMREKDILFSGELSGHYYWGGELFYEVPFYVIFNIMRELKERGAKMSELVAELPGGYYYSGEINFEVEDISGKMKEVEEKYKDGEISRLDGLKVEFPDWWFIVRASNTEDLLRLIVEADTQEKLDDRVAELRKIIELGV